MDNCFKKDCSDCPDYVGCEGFQRLVVEELSKQEKESPKKGASKTGKR